VGTPGGSGDAGRTGIGGRSDIIAHYVNTSSADLRKVNVPSPPVYSPPLPLPLPLPRGPMLGAIRPRKDPGAAPRAGVVGVALPSMPEYIGCPI
jgi:hypothetical protein